MSISVKLIILFEDDDLIAIDKPAGIPVIPGRDDAVSIIEILAAQRHLPFTGADDPRLRVVHRIDKDTSGVLLFAKNSAAQRMVSQQFQNNTIQKEYVALVAGQPTVDESEIDAPIGVNPKSYKRMAILKHGGRPARTAWKVERKFRLYTWLRIFPKTGKTHQIRVHLAHIGLPLAIDDLYNPRSGPVLLSSFKRGYQKTREVERPLIDRLTLHAEKLQFKSPAGNPLEVISPLPKDLRATLNMLAKYGV